MSATSELLDEDLAEEWPDDRQRYYGLAPQAIALAHALGHRLGKNHQGEVAFHEDWQHPGEFAATCVNSGCFDQARVRPRSLERQQLGGEAIGLRCRARPAY